MIQGDLTFQGQPRPITTPPDGVSQWIQSLPNDQIVHDHWEREYCQRNAVKAAVREIFNPSPDDVIIISDVDEIPDPRHLEEAVKKARQGWVVCFNQIHTYFALNLVDSEPWYGTRMLTWAKLQITTPQNMRSVISKDSRYFLEPQHLMQQGGWHFGWVGDKQAIRDKVASFCHVELNTAELMSDSYLDHCLKQKVTVHNGHQLSILPMELLPECVQANPERYKHLMASVL